MRRSSPRGSLVARIDAASGYDVVLSMGAVAAGEPTTVARSLATAAPDLAASIAAFAPSDWMWAHLVTVVADAPAPRDAEALIAHLESVPARELVRRLIGYYVRWFRRMTPPDVMDAALAGRPAARAELLRTSQPDDPAWQASLRARIDAGPERTKRDLLVLASEWHEQAAAPVLGRSERRLRAAASIRRRALRGRGPAEVASAFLGYEYVPEPGITRVVIVPSLVIGSVHEFEHEQTKFVCAPAGGVAAPRAPTLALRRIRALADESRMRIALALARGDLGAQELADRTGLGLPTVLHHLSSLRDARLVIGGGRRRPYRLGRAALRDLSRRIRSLADG